MDLVPRPPSPSLWNGSRDTFSRGGLKGVSETLYEKHSAGWLAGRRHSGPTIFVTVVVMVILSPVVAQLL